MSKRRTREQKIIAGLKKQLQTGQRTWEIKETKTVDIRPEKKSNSYVADRPLVTTSIKRDLIKTLVITALGVVVQFGIKAYLDNGGWSAVMRLAGA